MSWQPCLVQGGFNKSGGRKHGQLLSTKSNKIVHVFGVGKRQEGGSDSPVDKAISRGHRWNTLSNDFMN